MPKFRVYYENLFHDLQYIAADDMAAAALKFLKKQPARLPIYVIKGFSEEVRFSFDELVERFPEADNLCPALVEITDDRLKTIEQPLEIENESDIHNEAEFSQAKPAIDDSSKYYATVAQELSAGNIQQGLWIRAFADSNGNAGKGSARYIKYRVAELKALESKSTNCSASSKAVQYARNAFLILCFFILINPAIIQAGRENGHVEYLVRVIIFGPLFGSVAAAITYFVQKLRER